jgi:PPK2 family polyphosphate:nucleotide phosphotransferase
MKTSQFKSTTQQIRPSQTDIEDYYKSKPPKLKKLQNQIAELQKAINAEAVHSVLIIFQAMDAAGKDSTIRNVFNCCDIAGIDNVSFKQPSKLESSHDFLWRCHKEVPKKGDIVIFNRSHYEEVLVVKVHPEWLGAQGVNKNIDDQFWQNRYKHINNFEDNLTDSGTKIIKFMLDVSQSEQHDRFLRRYNSPEKQWKFSIGDLKESVLWEKYQSAFDDMLSMTSTEKNPWYVIPADDKNLMRLLVAEIIVDELTKLNPQYPTLTEFKEPDKVLIEDLHSGKLKS